MAVGARDDIMHELGTHWSGSRSGFPWHKVCTSPAPSWNQAHNNAHNEFATGGSTQAIWCPKYNEKSQASYVTGMHRTIRVNQALNGWRAWWLQADCRLDNKRSLTSFSVAGSTRCQTSWIPPQLTQDGIPPTMTSGDETAVIVPVNQANKRSNQCSLGRTSDMTSWMSLTWTSGLAGSMQGTRVHELSWALCSLSTRASVADPRPSWSLCPWRVKHITPLGDQQTLSDVGTACNTLPRLVFI